MCPMILDAHIRLQWQKSEMSDMLPCYHEHCEYYKIDLRTIFRLHSTFEEACESESVVEIYDDNHHYCTSKTILPKSAAFVGKTICGIPPCVCCLMSVKIQVASQDMALF